MNDMRAAATALAIAIGLMPVSRGVRAAPVPATLAPHGAVAGETSEAITFVAAALADSFRLPLMAAAIAPRLRPTSVPMVMAGGAVTGGASLLGGARTYASRTNGVLWLGISTRLALEARTGLLTLDRGDDFERRLVRSEVRLRRGALARGAWAGAALERALTGTRLPAAPLLGLGGWTAAGEATLAFSLEQTIERARIVTVLRPEPPADTVGALFTTRFDSRLVRATSALMSGRWEHRRIAVESVAGITISRYTTPRRWIQTSFDVALRPRLSLFTTWGSPAPHWLALEPGLSRRASLGLKLTSAVNAAAADAARSRSDAPEFKLLRLGEGWYVIKVRAAAAGRVEVMGDFSAWEPRALRHVNGQRWAVAVKLELGLHQIQVRVDDGAWSPPAGLPTAADGFNGDVGVFVAR